MKTLAGLLALGFFCLASHSAHATLTCEPSAARGIYHCAQSISVDTQYSWDATYGYPPLSAGGTFEPELIPLGELQVPRLMRYTCPNINAWPVTLSNGEQVQDTLTVTITSGLPFYPPPFGTAQQVQIVCRGMTVEAMLAFEEDWYQWEMNIMYYWALITGGQGQMPNFCYFWGTPFSCIDYAGWDGYGVTMFMMGWYNTYFW